jgi:ABC-2 type transport system ATP-binding protein
VALAFVGRPRAVFLDEPTVGLDLDARRRVWDVIREHAAAGGSVLLTTHHFDEAGALADRVAVIDEGQIVAGGTPAALRAGFGSVSLEEAVVRVLAGGAR